MKQKDKNEKGIALLFTLGILSLLLVLAVAFATSALNQKKLAQNSSNVTLARLLAESAVERAIASIEFYLITYATTNLASFYSQEANDTITANRGTYDWLWKLDTCHNGVAKTWNSAENINWKYIYNGETDNRIIGRIGYTVAGAEGKLDPAACVSTTVNENGANESRYGVDVNEINIQNLDPTHPATDYLPAADPSGADFSSVNGLSVVSVGGKLPNTTRWTDMEDLFSKVGCPTTATGKAKRKKWSDWFTINTTKDGEKYWIDDNANGKIDTDEYYDRFNLARTVATPITDILCAPVKFVNSGTRDGVSIPWIKNWTETVTTPEAGNWPDAATKKNQIAANIKDYCDTDSIATTDSETAPTYTGNDKTPYIYGFLINFQGVVTDVASGTIPARTYTPTVTIPGLYLDVRNMYDSDLAVTGSVEIVGSFDWAPGITGTGTTVPFSFTFAGGNALSFANNALGTKKAYSGTGSGCTATVIPTTAVNLSGGRARSITNLNITTLKIKLVSATGSNFADFSYIPISGPYTISATGANTQLWITSHVKDPRQNLHAADWSTPTTGPTWTTNGQTFGLTNTGDSPALGDDTETATEPYNVSTAFIRNGPMLSPWELGFIHRGANWQTLNIDKYNTAQGVSATAGGGAYADGDANILDQIKMTNAISVWGKLNIRSPNSDCAKALIYGIRYGTLPNNGTDATAGTADDNDPALGGTLLDPTVVADRTKVTTLASAISAPVTRAQIANVTALSDGVTIPQTTDATKEEIIGKIVNLTKSEISISDEINLIVIAQAIRDIGGGTFKKDMNFDSVISNGIVGSTHYNLGFYLSDGTVASTTPPSVDESKACTLGGYDPGFDEILAEQKVLVRLKYDASAPTGQRWKVIRYEYVE